MNHSVFWAIWPEALVSFRDIMTMVVARRIQAGESVVAKPASGPAAKIINGVSVIPIRGVMLRNPPDWMAESYNVASTEGTRRAVMAAADDESVNAIVMQIDTPGGSVEGLPELGDAVYQARQKKPVVAQVDGMMASAGYYVGSQASAIYARRMDLVGSIGARMVVWDWSKYFADVGVKVIPIDSSPADRPFKSAGVPGTEVTDQQVADFQRVIDGYGEDFKSAIMRGRGMQREQVDAVADGRIWNAAEARSLGLIDDIQGIEDTISEMNARFGRLRMAQAKQRQMGV